MPISATIQPSSTKRRFRYEKWARRCNATISWGGGEFSIDHGGRRSITRGETPHVLRREYGAGGRAGGGAPRPPLGPPGRRPRGPRGPPPPGPDPHPPPPHPPPRDPPPATP